MKVKSSIFSELEIFLNCGVHITFSGKSGTLRGESLGSVYFKASDIPEIIEALRRVQKESIDLENKLAQLKQL